MCFAVHDNALGRGARRRGVLAVVGRDVGVDAAVHDRGGRLHDSSDAIPPYRTRSFSTPALRQPRVAADLRTVVLRSVT